MIDDDTGVVDDDPARWPKIVGVMLGQGPTPPAIEPPTRLSGIEGRLDQFGWLVRPHSTGGFFCWCPTGTKYCHDLRELGKFASQIKAAAREADARKAAATPKPAKPPARSKSEAKNLARDRRVQLKNAFFDALGRAVARVTAGRGDQQAGGAS